MSSLRLYSSTKTPNSPNTVRELNMIPDFFQCHTSVKIQDKESLHHNLPVILLTNRQKHRDNKQLTWPLWKKLINSMFLFMKIHLKHEHLLKNQCPLLSGMTHTVDCLAQILIGLHHSRTAFRQTINLIPMGHMISLQPTLQLIFSYTPEWEIYLFYFNLLHPIHSVL